MLVELTESEIKHIISYLTEQCWNIDYFYDYEQETVLKKLKGALEKCPKLNT